RKRRGGAVSPRQAQKRTREADSAPEMALQAEPIELVESAGDDVVDLTCEPLEPVVVDLTHNDSVVSAGFWGTGLPRWLREVGRQEALGSAWTRTSERRRPRRNARRPRQDHADSCVVSSDEEELSRDRDVYVAARSARSAREDGAPALRYRRQLRVREPRLRPRPTRQVGPAWWCSGRAPSGTVSCPICMDGYSEIVQSGRLIVSTECGHVFCSQCLRDSLKSANTCPTCRKKIGHKRYHPIYI
ncbi:E3 ubiquitin-protein ligase RNF4, partial [Galemys pyrenaicus]